MMDPQERAVLFKSLAGAVKEYFATGIRAFVDRLDAVEKLLMELPTPKDGVNGRDGIDGKDGAPGKDGERGADGINGKDGTAGLNGKDGEIGPVGPKGEKGDPGERGEKGERGERGETGPPGIQGERGLDGLASDGKDGRDGRDGINGKDGSPGKDALQIDILPSVDFAKAYPRGTFARHDGGLIRAFRDTIPGDSLATCGFEVIVNGISSAEVVRDDNLRDFTFQFGMTDGRVIERKFYSPVELYKGVWKVGNVYTRADTVTKGGNQFYCIAESSSIAPDTPNNKDWVLSVRAGRDGKSYEPPVEKPEPKPLALR